ncbi:MAG TPA: hypothetical protein VJH23_01580 [archaeon]|nr:hypothetical protein [archaeon]
MASQQQMGSYAFLVGVAIAIIVGALSAAGQASMLGAAAAWVPLVLIILGIVVGFLNVKDKETDKFLIASLALLAAPAAVQWLNLIPGAGIYLSSIVGNVAVFVAPAALIVALKSIHALASEQVN